MANDQTIVKNLWIIETQVLTQLFKLKKRNPGKGNSTRELSIILDFPHTKNQPAMSIVLERLKKKGLVKYNATRKKNYITPKGERIYKLIK